MKKLHLQQYALEEKSISIYYNSGTLLFYACEISALKKTQSISYHHENTKRQKQMGKILYSIKYFVNFIGMEYFEKICEK